MDLVKHMAAVGSCWSPSFSPDGSELAFISDLTGTPQVWTMPVEGGFPRLVTGTDDQITQVRWSTQGLAYLLSPGGGLNRQIYLVNADGTGTRRLTDGGRENNWLAGWTHDNGAIMMASNRRTADAMDGYLLDPHSGEKRLIYEAQGVCRMEDISPDGRLAALFRLVNRGSSDVVLVELETGEQTVVTPHEGPGSFSGARFIEGAVLLAGDPERELVALCRAPLDETGRPGPLEVLAGRDDAELQEFDVHAQTAALLWNAAGLSELAFYDLETGTLTAGPDLPAEVASEITFSPDGKRLAFVLRGAAAPRDIWVYDRETQALTQLTHSPHPGVVFSDLIRPELIEFTAHDGLELTGWLYLPKDYARPGPVVLSFHGGPESQERPTFNSTYQALLAEGIAVFAPNVRGSTGFGKTFASLDNAALRVDAVQDIESCVEAMVNRGIASPGRIGIMGGSYGGYMTMAGLTTFPDAFAAGANICGIVNFETFFAHTEPWMAAISKVEYGDPDTQADLLRSLSPIHNINRVKGATIVLHGANDTNVPVVEAEQIVSALKRRAIPVEYVRFEDEGHGFTKEQNRITATVAIVRWFAKHLLYS